MDEDPKSKGWWHTLPGVLTAVTGVMTAVTGFIVSLQQARLFDKEDKPVSQERKLVVPEPKTEPQRTPNEAGEFEVKAWCFRVQVARGRLLEGLSGGRGSGNPLRYCQASFTRRHVHD